MTQLSILGCGFVADLYMRSLATFPHARVHAVWDHDPARLDAFTSYWNLPKSRDFPTFLQITGQGGLILNLTPPEAHFDTSRACLDAGLHVWSEKPMTLSLDDAKTLTDQADSAGLHMVSAPSSVLSEAAQLLLAAVRNDTAGQIRLIYAELDDGFIPQAPWDSWQSESGAPWPAENEFRTGCTLEHAGYYLSWLIAIFGPVITVTSTAARTIPDLLPEGAAPDLTVATLTFAAGQVARLTCSIVGPHDHRIRLIGDKGVLQVKEAWDNSAPVRFHRRFRIRRRLLEHPIGKRLKHKGKTHPKVKRTGAASMNFALGPMELAAAIAAGRVPRLTNAYSLHLTEVTLAIQAGGITRMTTTCDPLDPEPWAT